MTRVAKRFSLLGLVLVAASAVTAAVLPSNSDESVANGVISDSTSAGDSKTCRQTVGGDECTVTADSTTTEGIATTSDVNHSSDADGTTGA